MKLFTSSLFPKLGLGFYLLLQAHEVPVSSSLNPAMATQMSKKRKVGEDVVGELTKSMETQGLNMRVTALVNGTIGTLARGRYYDCDVVITVKLGTGTNAAYVEQAHSIPKWHGLLPKSGEMVGMIIGKGGETFKTLQTSTGAQI